MVMSFWNKHQIATQNINADMIEGIDLYTNYSGFAIASGGDGAKFKD
jgi:hypothetical protein